MIDLRHENDTATLRTDGRKLNETRQVSFELGSMQNASGSAIYTIGNTKVAAFVQGPHQVSKCQNFDVHQFLTEHLSTSSIFIFYRSIKEELVRHLEAFRARTKEF